MRNFVYTKEIVFMNYVLWRIISKSSSVPPPRTEEEVKAEQNTLPYKVVRVIGVGFWLLLLMLTILVWVYQS